MFSVLIAVLAAAPVEVAVGYGEVNGEQVAQAMRKASRGAAPVDGSRTYLAVYPVGQMLGFSDFANFQAQSPRDWPGALEETWTRGMAGCRALAGPPPWREHLTTVMDCASRLTEYLWQSWLDQQKATRVLIVSASKDAEKNEVTVKATAYAPGSTSMIVAEETGNAAGLPARLDATVKKALAGEGATKHRTVMKSFQDEAQVDPFAGKEVVSTEVKVAKPCDALPSAITISPASVVGSSVVARWAASVKGQGAPVACTLVTFRHDEDLEGTLMPAASLGLTCGKVTMSAVMLLTPGNKRTPVDLFSDRLLTGMAARLCR